MAESSRRTSETTVKKLSAAMPDHVEEAKNITPSRQPLVDVEKAQRTAPLPASISEDEAEKRFQPKTLKFWSIIVSIFLALFLVALDRTIIGTATPQITQEFHSLGDIGWYGSSYQLTTAASQLLFGRVYRFYEVKRTFLVTVALFEIGSVICGAAPNSIVFIVGRAIAGLGSAGIFSGVMIIMIPMIPLRKRPVFQGVFGMVFGLASVLGPLVGGAFTDGVTWRWCFYVNLPIGAVAALCLILILRTPRREKVSATVWQQIIRLDPLGTFFFVPSIVCLLIALQWGGSTYAWNSWRILVLLVVFAVLFLAFAAVQIYMPTNATVPVRVISRRSILAAAIFMFALAGSFLMAIYFLPLWFQIVQGASAVQSGINTLPFVLSLVVASILSGVFTQKLGYYVPAMIASPSLLAVGQGLMSTFRVDEVASHWIGFQVVAGFGLGIGMQASNLAAQAILPLPDVPTGISIMFFAQQLGGGIFTSVGQNLLSTYMVSHLVDIPGVDPGKVTSEGAGDLVANVPQEYRLAVREVYNEALSRIFLCAMGVALAAVVAALFMEWKNIKKVGPPRGEPPGTKSPKRPKDADKTLTPENGATATPEFSGETSSASESQNDPTEKPTVRMDFLQPNGSSRQTKELATPPSKIGCEHCEHCRLSRAITLEPSDATGPNPFAEGSRLTSLARDAVAHTEELTGTYSIPSAMGSSNQQPLDQNQDDERRQSIAAPEIPDRDERRDSVTRRPTVQDLLQNAQRLSAQLEMEEREERESREEQKQLVNRKNKRKEHRPRL
ncbi:major facilitator superfamily domain-containing protein [Biscogniauxia marginata]|nr:major facilitator superfamily domain-containing protein [Biscogniauxia marginata]